MTMRCRVVWALFALAACARSRESRRGAAPTDNPEVARQLDDDQRARSRPIESADMDALRRQDSVHRVRLRTIEAAGALRTAHDYYHAAMIYQHGWDSLSYERAYAFARRREAMDSTDEAVLWLVAASWDRLQQSRGQPQWYGTQTMRRGGAGPVLLYTLDAGKVSDAERTRRVVGTVAQLQARLDTVNRRLGLR